MCWRTIALVLKAGTTFETRTWGPLLNIVQSLQSSILSYPAFCDETGLWIHRVEFSNEPLVNRTSVYFIFGLDGRSLLDQAKRDLAKEQFDLIGKAMDSLVAKPATILPEKVPSLVDKLFQEIANHHTQVRYNERGLRRWLSSVYELMKKARHEGHPIMYNVGYGSLAYAQSHLRVYEPAPTSFSSQRVPVETIATYVKGFYSIFGMHPDRGLWFDESGGYCGIYENPNYRDFERTKIRGGVQSQHEDTVLFAKD